MNGMDGVWRADLHQICFLFFHVLHALHVPILNIVMYAKVFQYIVFREDFANIFGV